MSYRRTTLTVSFTTVTLLAGPAFGVELVDDFDNPGDYLTRVFTPGDYSADNGLFPGAGTSRFDRFGIVDRSVVDGLGGEQFALPYQAIDTSVAPPSDGNTAGSASPDAREGFLRSDATKAVVVTDPDNNLNPGGDVGITWTFDVSGLSNLGLRVDLVGQGDFETADTFSFSAQLDGGTVQQDLLAVTLAPLGTGGERPVNINTMEDGDTFDRIAFNGGWSSNTWDELLGGAPAPGIQFAAGDADQDGFDDATGERAYGQEDTNSPGTFDDELEYEPLFDPLAVTVGGTTTTLNNVFTPFQADIAGTGSTLTIIFEGNSNGSDEYFAFDNLTILGDAATGEIDGDYNDSGLVEQGDLDQVLSNWGAGFASIPGTWINQRPTEGIVDQAELDVVLTEWGSSAAPDFAGSNVPEPATLALLGLGGLAMLRRRA